MTVNSESADNFTISRYSRCSGVRWVSRTRSVMPMMPFMGVRISWLTLARNSLLCRLATSAISFCWRMVSLASPAGGFVPAAARRHPAAGRIHQASKPGWVREAVRPGVARPRRRLGQCGKWTAAQRCFAYGFEKHFNRTANINFKTELLTHSAKKRCREITPTNLPSCITITPGICNRSRSSRATTSPRVSGETQRSLAGKSASVESDDSSGNPVSSMWVPDPDSHVDNSIADNCFDCVKIVKINMSSAKIWSGRQIAAP